MSWTRRDGSVVPASHEPEVRAGTARRRSAPGSTLAAVNPVSQPYNESPATHSTPPGVCSSWPRHMKPGKAQKLLGTGKVVGRVFGLFIGLAAYLRGGFPSRVPTVNRGELNPDFRAGIARVGRGDRTANLAPRYPAGPGISRAIDRGVNVRFRGQRKIGGGLEGLTPPGGIPTQLPQPAAVAT